MQHDHILKKVNFDLLIIRLSRGGGGGGGRGGCMQNICYHVAILRDFILFEMQHDHDLMKWNFNFDQLTSCLGWGGG